VWGEISNELKTFDGPIFYTGHSLGAALATLAAARRAPKALYTFGSPRVGNAAFIASLGNIPIYRVVDDRDLVATVPPEALGFRHAGVLRLLKEPRTGTLFDWIGVLIAPPKPLADHAPINYVDRI
jgi:alpha-beta hydrolase superfamily lysophospholipase